MTVLSQSPAHEALSLLLWTEKIVLYSTLLREELTVMLCLSSVRSVLVIGV